jgi:hypothetical protein
MSTSNTTAQAQASNNTDTDDKEKKLLHSAMTHLKGHIDFGKVATDIQVPNAEAA